MQPFAARFLALTCLVSISFPVCAADRPPLEPGLLASISVSDATCQRVDEVPVIRTARDASIDKRLPNGSFVVTWSGRLMSQNQGEYRLFAHVQGGTCELSLNDTIILQGRAAKSAWLTSRPVELPFDWHRLKIVYKSTSPDSRLTLFWSGPGFQLEPISERFFYHERSDSESVLDVERAQTLVHGLRCAACHELNSSQPLPAPALNKLAGNLRRQWLIDWLSAPPPATRVASRRMPHFGLTKDDAAALADYLVGDMAAKAAPPQGAELQIDAGRKLVLTRGCLACHGVGELGDSNLYGGGDLTTIVTKRPPGFIQKWLADPSRLNVDHRMPVFRFQEEERVQIASYLESLHAAPAERKPGTPSRGDRRRGRELFQSARCFACHGPPTKIEPPEPFAQRKLTADSNWTRSCLHAPDRESRRPGFHLNEQDAQLVEQFVSQSAQTRNPSASQISGKLLVAENNCLACHKRGAAPGLAEKMPDVIDVYPEFGPLVPAMTPPALTSVGDKLHDAALTQAVERASGDRRPWLEVKMPRFKLTATQRRAIVDYLVAADRIPDDAPTTFGHGESVATSALDLAGRRLVTTDGFGCTSCHQVGSQKPSKAPLNAKGPDLAMLNQHIRKPWFDRWVRNPSRIVPRMEMPSVKTPVQGVLDDHLDDQLAAVWHVLNQPNFEPPQPNPVRVLRRSGVARRNERAAFVTDVLRVGKTTLIKPLLVGLPNRHNVLFDLEAGRLAGWTIGDAARQRTKGKTWYWELAGEDLLQDRKSEPEISLVRGGKPLQASRRGQFITEATQLHHIDGGIRFSYRLAFADGSESRVIEVTEVITPHRRGERADGFRRHVEINGLQAAETIRHRVGSGTISDDQRTMLLAGGHHIALVQPNDAQFQDGAVTLDAAGGRCDYMLLYTSPLQADQFVTQAPVFPQPDPKVLHVVAGFDATRLPAFSEMMPTGLAWRPDGELIITSLKGRVWSARDTNDDGLEDSFRPFSDELAAPFGVAAFGEDSVDVVNKYGLLRLTDSDHDGFAEHVRTLASGWGHTADYHDWAIGLPRDKDGSYYVSIACQQDDRSQAAAKHRGEVLKLVPNADATQYTLTPISAGHRFPVGIARNRAGDLFVTDNQGNFNPFNELNHVQAGKRYGFINKVDRQPDFKPPLTPPAIDIPHPWTRSVNGICFLESATGQAFGPFEGHLIGCEYDTRQLIRMSLQQVGETMQGAAYPFTYYQPKQGASLLGPLVCAVSPRDELYVGCIRDSGWGGANNIGTIVKLQPKLASMPAGIAEVRATPTGFELDFTQPVDRARAADSANYAISSYTRASTPAYGGPDRDRRQDEVQRVMVNAAADRVQLQVGDLRAGFVYEIRLKNITQDKAEFFPAEAFYTMRTVPRD